jgi:hypothetical protein
MGRDVKANPRGVVPPSLFANEIINSNRSISANKIFFISTASGPVTVTLPPEPFEGDIIKIFDTGGTFASNNLTVDPGAHKIMRLNDTMVVSTEGASFTLVYSGTTNGWLVEGI